MKFSLSGLIPFTKKRILRVCLGLSLIAALSGCGPSGPLPTDPLSAPEEIQIEQEVDQELKNQSPDEYLPDYAMDREEFAAYMENLRQNRILKKRTERRNRTPPIVPEPETTTSPSPSPIPEPTAPEADEHEEFLSASNVVYRPAPAPGYNLAKISEHFGELNTQDYAKIQYENLKTNYPACNYFVISALSESDYIKMELGPKKISGTAKVLETTVLTEENGWKKTDLKTLRDMLQSGVTVDAIYQRSPPKPQPGVKEKSGHIGVIIGLDKDLKFIAAQGNLGKYTNRIVSLADDYLKTFTLFIRTPEITEGRPE